MKTLREELIDFTLKLTEECMIAGSWQLNVENFVDEYLKSINSNAPTESRNVATHEDKKEHLKGQQGCHSLKCLHPSQKDCEGCDAYF